YGQHLSKDEAHELMAPHPDTPDVVSQWLVFHGIDEANIKYSSTGDFMTISAPGVRVAESMFDTDFHVYADSGDALARTTKYSIPEVLHNHVNLVQPLVMLAPPPQASKPATPSSKITSADLSQEDNAVDPSCDYQINPNCLRQLYNIGNYTASPAKGNVIAVSAFEEQYASYTDYALFVEGYAPSASGANFSVVPIIGGINDATAPGVEANLDIRYAFGLTWPIPATFYTVDNYSDTAGNGNYTFATAALHYIDFLLDQTDIPPVISNSYGNDETIFTPAQANKICQGFAALGAHGVSVLYSSGDNGVGYFYQEPTPFLIHFPGSCPYVTMVGMTTGIKEVSGTITEFASSGGGFSNYFPRPSYQDKQANDYLSYLGDQYQGLYNSSGRGYSDVSAQGIDYLIEYYGYTYNETGTSAATPAFAAVIALLNDVRMDAGKGPVGFLNPWLYSSGYAELKDITEGSNPSSGTNGFNSYFSTSVQVTGFGTPDFAKLKELVIAQRVDRVDKPRPTSPSLILYLQVNLNSRRFRSLSLIALTS
ncbi:subtilisin-like protein, partial [Coniophora puteana RWD-64-598 SS2]